MALFFPANADKVKINASNSQIGVTVGDTMSITAGDTFTIGAGSTSAIKVGPTTNFSLASTVDLKLSSSLSYTYGYKAEYGGASSATATTGSQNAIDSYTIKAGSIATIKNLRLAKNKQLAIVITAAIVSMAAIATGVVGGLANPMFIKNPSTVKDTVSRDANGNPILDDNGNPVMIANPNAVPNDSSSLASASCALAITTLAVFMTQWALTVFLARTSTFTPVCTVVFDKAGINTKVEAEAATSTVPLAQTIMSASSLIQQVSEPSLVAPSPQLSEITLLPKSITMNTTANAAGVATHNTQIIMNSDTQTISLLSDSASTPNGGGITIGQNTNIANPNGTTTLESFPGVPNTGLATVILNGNTSATLSCGNATNTGSVIATPTGVNIGFNAAASSPSTGNAVFDATSTTINGATVTIAGSNINLGGGALTIIGTLPQTNSNLANVMRQMNTSNSKQMTFTRELLSFQTQINLLQTQLLASQELAKEETELLKAQIFALSKK